MQQLAAFISVLKDQGWGVAGLELLAILWLIKKWDACNELGRAEAAKSAALGEKTIAAMTLMSGALETRMGKFERLDDHVQTSSRDSEVSRQLIIGKIDAVATEISRFGIELAAIRRAP